MNSNQYSTIDMICMHDKVFHYLFCCCLLAHHDEYKQLFIVIALFHSIQRFLPFISSIFFPDCILSPQRMFRIFVLFFFLRYFFIFRLEKHEKRIFRKRKILCMSLIFN